jgi:hypothetical protein
VLVLTKVMDNIMVAMPLQPKGSYIIIIIIGGSTQQTQCPINFELIS